MPRRRRRFVARNKKQALLRLTLVVLLLALIVTGVVFAVRALLSPGKETAALQTAPFGAGDAYAYTGKGFLYFSGGKLCYVDDADSRNDYELSVSTNSSDLGLSAGESLSALYNASFIVITGAEAPVEVPGEICKVICGKEHLAAYVKTGDADSIAVFDKTGNAVDQLDFSQGLLTKFGVDAAAEETLWTLTLDDTGGAPISTITTYNLAQSVTNGLMTVQNELVEDVRFTPSSIFAVGTNHIIRYSRTGNAEVYRALVYGWRVSDFEAGASPCFLLRSRTEEGFKSARLLTLAEGDAANESLSTVQFPAGTISAFLCGGRLCAFTESAVYYYGLDGALQASLPLGATAVSSAVKLSPTKALLTAGTEMLVLNIK